MRKISFRGKSIDSSEFVFGTPYYKDDKSFIKDVNSDDIFEVKPESISQYIGICDKNGVDVFDGDIVNVRGAKRVGFYQTKIVWRGIGFCLEENKTMFVDYKILKSHIEVIGNVF